MVNRLRLYFSIFILIILLMIAFIFGSQNNQLITLNYIIARTELSIAAAVSLFTSLGFVIGIVASMVFRLVNRVKPSQNS